MTDLNKVDPRYRDTVEFIDSWFINWSNTVARKHGVTSKASELFALGDLMHDVMMDTVIQKMEADNE